MKLLIGHRKVFWGRFPPHLQSLPLVLDKENRIIEHTTITYYRVAAILLIYHHKERIRKLILGINNLDQGYHHLPTFLLITKLDKIFLYNIDLVREEGDIGLFVTLVPKVLK